jgi:predicted polyphosphate/ATP-dependent NAD kinase
MAQLRSTGSLLSFDATRDGRLLAKDLNEGDILDLIAENIVIVSSLEKFAGLPGNFLLVDTGDEDVDAELAGYLPVIVSEARTVLMPVKSVATEIAADRSAEEPAT